MWGSGGMGDEGRGTMTKDNWTDRLSEYVDGTLAVGERAALEAHLTGCAACAVTLEELRRVVARARALDDRPPAADLWPKIAVWIARAARARGDPGQRLPQPPPRRPDAAEVGAAAPGDRPPRHAELKRRAA